MRPTYVTPQTCLKLNGNPRARSKHTDIITNAEVAICHGNALSAMARDSLLKI